VNAQGNGIIGFLHTAEPHRATFDGLVSELAPRTRIVTVVEPSLLADAQRTGPGTPSIQRRIVGSLDELAADGADVVVCTCSTIAGEAEKLYAHRAVPLVRIDRPMAQAAVASGSRLAVVAALESTLQPTVRLLRETARKRQTQVEITTHVSVDAWAHFTSGDLPNYYATVARTCAGIVGSCDAIVLAQASMAPVDALLDLDLPVLASPRLAVEAAITRIGAV